MLHKPFFIVILVSLLLMSLTAGILNAQSASPTPLPAAATPLVAPQCSLTPQEGFANVRTLPNTDAPVATTLDRGETALGLAKLVDVNGTLWYFTPGGWTADVAVNAEEACASLFTIAPYATAVRRHVEILYEAVPGEGEADAYLRQDSMFGNVPRLPALTFHSVTVKTASGSVECAGVECGNFAALLYIPTSGRVSGFFSSTPQPGATPEPISLERLLFTSPQECLPLGAICMVNLIQMPSVNSACPPAVFDAGLPVSETFTPLEMLTASVEVLREAALRSTATFQVANGTLPPDDSTPCAFNLYIPVNRPREIRFSTIAGGVEGIFDVIRVLPPESNS